MTVVPSELALSAPGELTILWSDGMKRVYGFAELRAACPCASCRERRTRPPEPPPLLPVIDPREAAPPEIRGMDPVGAYAYHIRFSDGHDTGIYPLELLRELGREC